MLRLLLPLSLLVLAGCASAPPAAAPDRSESEPVVRLERVGGFTLVGADFSTPPALSLYGDGRGIAPAPTTAVFPGPLVPPLEEFTVPEGSVALLLDRARELGLDEPRNYGTPPIADAGATVVTISFGEDVVSHSAEALSESVSGPASGDLGLSAPQVRAREDLLAFVEELGMLPREDGQLFEPAGYRVAALPLEGSPPEGFEFEEVPWPLPNVPPATLASSRGAESVTLAGAEADPLLPVLAGASSLTVFVEDGVRYQLLVRPLLPDEL